MVNLVFSSNLCGIMRNPLPRKYYTLITNDHNHQFLHISEYFMRQKMVPSELHSTKSGVPLMFYVLLLPSVTLFYLIELI